MKITTEVLDKAWEARREEDEPSELLEPLLTSAVYRKGLESFCGDGIPMSSVIKVTLAMGIRLGYFIREMEESAESLRINMEHADKVDRQ